MTSFEKHDVRFQWANIISFWAHKHQSNKHWMSKNIPN